MTASIQRVCVNCGLPIRRPKPYVRQPRAWRFEGWEHIATKKVYCDDTLTIRAELKDEPRD